MTICNWKVNQTSGSQLVSTYSTGSLGTERYDAKGSFGEEDMGDGSRGSVSLPLASCPTPLPFILKRDDKKDQQGDTLDPCQEEEVIVQRAVVDVTWRERKQGHYYDGDTRLAFG